MKVINFDDIDWKLVKATIKYVSYFIYKTIYDWFFDWTYCDWYDIFFKMITLFIVVSNIVFYIIDFFLPTLDPLKYRQWHMFHMFILLTNQVSLISLINYFQRLKNFLKTPTFGWGSFSDECFIDGLYGYWDFGNTGFDNLPVDIEFISYSLLELSSDMLTNVGDLIYFWDDEDTMGGWCYNIDDCWEETNKPNK